MANKPTFTNVMRMWLGLVGIMGVGNSIQCFVSETYLLERLYTVDSSNVSGLTTRLFAAWSLLTAGLRFMCAFNITNKTIYSLTLFSFVLALVHFLLEVFFYKTAMISSPGIIAPLIISAVSIATMTLGYYFVNDTDPRYLEADENKDILSGRSRKKWR